MASTDAASKLTFTYNSFLADFLMLAKRMSPEMRERVKDKYRSIDKRDKSHIEFAAGHLPLVELAGVRPADLSNMKDVEFAKREVAEGIRIADVIGFEAAPGCSDDDKEAAEGLRAGMLRNMYVLACITRLHQLDANDATLTELLNLIMRIQAVATWAGWPEPAPAIGDLEESMQKVEDTTVKGLLGCLFNMSVISSSSSSAAPEVPAALKETFGQLQNSKIGAIAKEIAEELDVSSIDTKNPESWLDLSNITNPNSFLGNVVNKLGTKITTKMQNGELKQEDIFNDAMALMRSMSTAGGAGGAGGPMPPAMSPDFMQGLMSSMSALSSAMPAHQQHNKVNNNKGSKKHGN